MKKILLSTFIFLGWVFIGANTASAEVAIFRIKHPGDYYSGTKIEKGSCYPISLKETISPKLIGQTGPGCSFSMDILANGEWVTAGGYFDTPAYAWGKDEFYSVSDPGNSTGDSYTASFSYSCQQPSYVIDQASLPTYVKLTQQQDLASSNGSAIGKRYTFTVSESAPVNSSFNANVSFQSTCTMKKQGGTYEGSMEAVQPIDSSPDRCGYAKVIQTNPRKAQFSYPIRITGACVSPSPKPTSPPSCGGPCQVGADVCPQQCPLCVAESTGKSVCKAPSATPTPTSPPSCGGSCVSGKDICPQQCPICSPNSQGKTVCQAPSPTPTITPLPCNASCSDPTQCSIQCSQCVPGSNGGPSVCKAGCNQACSNPSQCSLDCPICSVNGRCQPPPPTPTLTPVPVCGAPCKKGIDVCPLNCSICASGTNGVTVCQAPSPTPTVTPLPCNAACADATQCSLACSQCVPGTSGQSVCKTGCGQSCTSGSMCPLSCPICSVNGTCELPSPTPTPSPIPCNSACSDPTQCSQECSQCVPGTQGGPSVCKASCGQSCTDASSCPLDCNVCAPSATTSNTVCRQPASCNCDGIDFTGELIPGQTINTTGFAKVENPDENDAKVLNMVFHVERDGIEVTKSDPIAPSSPERTTDANGAAIDRYASQWSYTIPAEGAGASTYRIFSKINCTYKSVASTTSRTIAQRGTKKSTVLGVSTTQSSGLLGMLSNWWNGLMGFNPSPTPTAVPQKNGNVDVNKFIFEANDSSNWYHPPAPTKTTGSGGVFDSLKLGTFNPGTTPTPTPIVEKMCKQFSFTLIYK